jgi:hypothetical protein
MGRSGTSALTRVLSLCGASLPQQLLAPNAGNPTGYWEPSAALELNDAFLGTHGSSWHDPALIDFGHGSARSRDNAQFVNDIRQFLASFGEQDMLLIKEPRITALSDFWFEAASFERYALHIVVPVRDPSEVAASLAARDGTPLELAVSLWLKYNLLAERNSRHLPRVFVEYSQVMTDWREQVHRISRSLDLDFSKQNSTEIDAFLRPDLYRQKKAYLAADDIPNDVRNVHEMLSEAARDKPLNLRSIDAAFGHFASAERYSGDVRACR